MGFIMLPSHRLPSGRSPSPSRNEESMPMNNAPHGGEETGLPSRDITQNNGTNPTGGNQLPPDLAKLLQGMGENGLQNRDISASVADISSLLKQKVLLVLESIMGQYNSQSTGILLSLKDFEVSSTSPAVVDIKVKCNVPRGKQDVVKEMLDSAYFSIVDILKEHIASNDVTYSKATKLSSQEQESFRQEAQAILESEIPISQQQGIITFIDGKPVCSLPPSILLSTEQSQEIITKIEKLCEHYRTVGIFFTGEIEYEQRQEEEKEEELRIKSRRSQSVNREERQEQNEESDEVIF